MTDSTLGDTSKITSSNVEKIKDPKRVEQGRKLAAISKYAKEKKAREKFESEKMEDSWNIDYGYVIGTAGVVTAVGALYFAYRQDRLLAQTDRMGGKEEPTVPCDRPKTRVDKIKEESHLDMFD